MGYSHQGHVMMPARPGTGFVVPHAHVSFAFFKEFLHAPANAGDLCQGPQWDMGIRIADVVFDLRLGLQGTADQEPSGRSTEPQVSARISSCTRTGQPMGDVSRGLTPAPPSRRRSPTARVGPRYRRTASGWTTRAVPAPYGSAKASTNRVSAGRSTPGMTAWG